MYLYGLYIPKTKQIIYSRAHHDCRMINITKHKTNPRQVGVDGGQPPFAEYQRFLGDPEDYQECYVNCYTINNDDLRNDWNRKEDKLGIIHTVGKNAGNHPPYRIIWRRGDEEHKRKVVEEAIQEFSYYKEQVVWGTYGKEGNEPFKYIRLVNANDVHLQAILTQHYAKIDPKTFRALIELHQERELEIPADIYRFYLNQRKSQLEEN